VSVEISLPYYDTATIMAVKSYKVQAPGACIIKLTALINFVT